MAKKAPSSKLMSSVFEIERYLSARMQETKQKTFGYRYGDYVKRRDNFNKVLSHLIKHPNHPSKVGNFVADQVAVFAKGFSSRRSLYQWNLAGLHSSLEHSQISKEDSKTLKTLKKLGELRLELRVEQKNFSNKNVSKNYLGMLHKYQLTRRSLNDVRHEVPSVKDIVNSDFTKNKVEIVRQAYKDYLAIARSSQRELKIIAKVLESTKEVKVSDWRKASAANHVGTDYIYSGNEEVDLTQMAANKGSLFQKKQIVQEAVFRITKYASAVDKKKLTLRFKQSNSPIAKYILGNLSKESPKVTFSR